MPLASKATEHFVAILLAVLTFNGSCSAQSTAPPALLLSLEQPADAARMQTIKEGGNGDNSNSTSGEITIYDAGESTSAITEPQNRLNPPELFTPNGSIDGSFFSHPTCVTLSTRLINDQVNLYRPESLLMMGLGLGAGSVFANTRLDSDIQRHLQSSLHHANSDDWLESLHANKELGDGRYTLPVFAGAWALGSMLPESDFSNRTSTWGEHTLRGFVVGAPPVLLLQKVTGSSRPGESLTGSEWEPFRDNNGVSGHAFMGALPFITAAKMTDKFGWKVTLYAASTLAPLSRAADGAHYPSQVALGWGMAFMAATAVHSTDNPDSRWRLSPTMTTNGSGMALEYRF